MDKTAIRNYAIEARKILMKSAITEAGFYGVTKDGCKAPVQKGTDFEVYETLAGTENRIFGDDIKRRANLVRAIEEQGFDQVIEETAYTWFNRIIAIRFMEVNNYLPTRVRVLSSETGSGTPDIIAQADTVELNLSAYELEKIQTAKRENRYDDAFRMLFIKQCNELNAILPGLFEKTDDYMELLLKITYTSDGVIRMLVDSIPEDNFNVETEGQVEIIGWMYQYYNTELKDDTFAKLKKNVKITKERIPAATQLFTPDWIVRYMVENSLGRVWIEHLRAVNPSVDEKAKAEEFGWKYYLPEAEQEDDVQAQLVEIRKSYMDLTPQDITCIDPCMGSGHILVYMFDVLMDIYRSEGFSEREAVFDILEKNLRGLDIDRRAYQLSYFALMMKARGYNRIFFRGHEDLYGNRVQAVPRVYAIEESNSVDREQLSYFGAGLDELSKNNAINQMNGLLDALHDAKEYGSILKIEKYDWILLRQFLMHVDEEGQNSLFGYMAYKSKDLLTRIINVAETLSDKYHAVVTNPPYMGSNGMGSKLLDFLKKEYPDTKSDLSTVMMEKALTMCINAGMMSMINIPVWMFLSTYEKMRKTVISANTITNMLHFGRGVFGSDFGTTSFVFMKGYCNNYIGSYRRLFEKQGAVDSVETKEKWFFEGKGSYLSTQRRFANVPGEPIAYWMSKEVEDDFIRGKMLGDVADIKQGLKTGDNDKFLRLWFEVAKDRFSIFDGLKWFPCNKGGDYRRWYGNNDYVINWENDGYELKNFKHPDGRQKSRPQNLQYQFKEGLTYTNISSSKFGIRYCPDGFAFDAAGSMIFTEKQNLYYLLGLLSSNTVLAFTGILSPTMSFEVGQISSIPYLEGRNDDIDALVDENIHIAKKEYDSYETSWDFVRHPLIQKVSLIETAFDNWKQQSDTWISRMKENEEELNRLFVKIYGLEGQVEANVDDEEITLRRADVETDVKSLISYAVGCMFGRYSLDKDGIICAGNSFNKSDYVSFNADTDAIIPITDENYYSDDIVGRFEDFLKTVYGADTIEDNLNYVASALGEKGGSSREQIRNYFINSFYKDHCSTYSVTGSGSRPIYWLFDSGDQNGFKCLIYLHRYSPDTVGLIRSDYLIKTQTMIENALKNAEYAIDTSSSAVDKAQATKNRDKYVKQLAEIRAYYPALSHIALQKIELNLDDGIRANYAKFQDIEVSVEGKKKQKVNLLAKI